MLRTYLSDSKVFTMFKRKLVDKVTDFQYSDIVASKDCKILINYFFNILYIISIILIIIIIIIIIIFFFFFF